MKRKTKNDYIQYTDVNKILEENRLQYLIMLGQRSNGKSFACKELVIRNAFDHATEFCYLRRHKQDIQDYMIIEYFADMFDRKDGEKWNKIEEITRGECDTIAVYRKSIYLAHTKEDGEPERIYKIGYAHALSGLEGLKSRQFPKVDYIIFEEFIATGLYLYNECDKLQNYVSTIFRTRAGSVIMIGNTISRIVPYFQNWQLDNIPKQQQGTVEVYKFHTNDIETRIGVFLCESLNRSSGMFFGHSAKMIVGGEWDRDDMPKLEKPVEEYETLYTMVFSYAENTKFLMRFLLLRSEPSKMLWYVEPKTTEIQDGTRVISPDLNESALYTKDFDPINEREKRILEYFRKGKIAYSDNLTGTEFRKCVEMLHSVSK